MDWEGEFWADEEEEEEDEDEEDEEVEEEDEEDEEEDEEEEDVVVGCCGLCPFLLPAALEAESCLGSGVCLSGEGDCAAVAPGTWWGSTGPGDDVRAGDDCLDDGCCLDFSSPSFRGGVSLFLRRGSSFGAAGAGLEPDSVFGPLPGFSPSLFSENLFLFLSFLLLPCF